MAPSSHFRNALRSRFCNRYSLELSLTTGVPHTSTQSDEYLGYHIPKGSLVMVNIWSVPCSCHHQVAIGSVLSKYHLGKWVGTLKYTKTLNPFVRNASSMASRLIQDRSYLALDVGKCSQICDHTSYMQLTPDMYKYLSRKGVWWYEPMACNSINHSLFPNLRPWCIRWSQVHLGFCLVRYWFLENLHLLTFSPLCFYIPYSHPEIFECVIKPRFGNILDLISQMSAAREI